MKPPTFRILQLSDIHFGSRFYYFTPDSPSGPDEWATRLADDIDACLRVHGIGDPDAAEPPFDLLVLSGDLTSFGQHRGMDAAVIFVEEVQQRRWWRARDILILPGNHDVVFGDPPQDMESISRVVIPLPKAERERLYRETYRRIRLATGVARTTRLEEIQSADSMGVLKADKSTRIAILGLDSTRVEGWSNPGLGFVGYDQLWAMAECLFKDYEQSDTPWRRIAFMHHHVLPMDEVSVQAAIALQWNRHFTLDYDAADLLQGAQDYKIDFLIHGHFHRPKVRAADNSTARPGRVLSAGSPSVRDGDCDSLHQFFLHELFDSMNRPRVSLRNSG